MSTAKRKKTTGRSRHIPGSRTMRIIVLLLLTGLMTWQIAEVTKKKSLDRLSYTGNLRIHLYAASLRDTLEKYRHLPYVLARDSRILALLHNAVPPVRVNPHLEDFAQATQALIYVLDQGGTTVATSNWRQPNSLMGHNYGFRPYFIAARSGQNGGYYAVGLRTHRPGFFLSYPVKDQGRFLGAIVVKVDLEPMQEVWKKSGETVIVSDSSGVIFLTSNHDWKYTSLRELPVKTVGRLQAVQYADAPLTALDMERRSWHNNLVLRLDNTDYLEQALQLPEYGWRIHYLTDLHTVKGAARLAILTSAGAAFTVLLTLLFMRERRQKLISRQEARRARTIEEINHRLHLEIAEHKKTEENLRTTQRELIQAGKLAALGRMSAAIAHELNQPVTAIRTFIASCRILLKRDQLDMVADNLDHIAGLTDRMGGLTGQLKTFARKNKAREETIDLVKTVNAILLLMEPQIRKHRILLTTRLPEENSIHVRGSSLQIEQVMSNLLHNGIDAVKYGERREIELQLGTTGSVADIIVKDSGDGIAAEALDSLFDPFYTTKDIGEGLGLGLSIAYGIIQDMGGRISAKNLRQGGACFTIELPMIEKE